MSRLRWILLFAIAACRSDHTESGSTSGDENGTPVHRGSPRAELCVETGDRYLQMPYDTNGDGAADVIRVYAVVANATSADGSRTGRRIVCREADVNGDGTRDVMRVYDARGRVAREQQDRDFDGYPDYWEYYEDGHLIRMEEDGNRDRRIDTRIYVDLQGRPTRIERDVAGRSTAGNWRADHFEFFAEGRLVRSGEDVDFDGAVDRWDRDLVYEAEVEARERAESSGGEAPDAGVPDAGMNDAGRPATSRP